MKILGIFYTNNKLRPSLLSSASSFAQHAATYTNLKGVHNISLVACAWEPILNWNHEMMTTNYRMGGHLNICMQVLKALYTHQAKNFDAVALLEHDCLYAPNYFDKIIEAFSKNAGHTVVNFDYMGMNEKGYVKWKDRQICLSQMCIGYPMAVKNFERAVRDCALQGWAFLEPKQDPPKDGFIYIMEELRSPNVHVNMNNTKESHHLTNHYDTYEKEPFAIDHPLWGPHTKYDFFNVAAQ